MKNYKELYDEACVDAKDNTAWVFEYKYAALIIEEAKKILLEDYRGEDYPYYHSWVVDKIDAILA